MTCTKCGKPLVDGATFCGYCGTPVSSLPQKCDGSANEPDCNTASTGDVDTSASSSSAASHSTFNVLKPFKKLFKWFFFPTFKDQNGSPIKPVSPPPVDKKLWYSHDKAERKAYRKKYNETYGENNRLYRKKVLPAILLRSLIIIALLIPIMSYKDSHGTNKGYRDAAIGAVSSQLRSPSTASFSNVKVVDKDKYGRAIVTMIVDAQNGFGAYIRSEYAVCVFKQEGEYCWYTYTGVQENSYNLDSDIFIKSVKMSNGWDEPFDDSNI